MYKSLTTLVLLGFISISLAKSKTYKIAFDKTPMLISDTLKKFERKNLAKSSLNQLDNNIYISYLNGYTFNNSHLFFKFMHLKDDYQLHEILGINNFYNDKPTEAIRLLQKVFAQTSDSSQKAKTAKNLATILYLEDDFKGAKQIISYAKTNLLPYLNFRQQYQLYQLDAKNALALKNPAKAEQIILRILLPTSHQYGGKLAELNCYLFLGKVYLQAKMLTQAKWFFIQANTLAASKNNHAGKIESYLLLAKAKIIAKDGTALNDLNRAKYLINEQSVYQADLQKLSKLARN